MKLRILKCHGSGNDFILIDETNEMNQPIPDNRRSELTRTLCDKKIGVGADGILFYLPSEHADCRMRMFNPDGREAELCGNGLRCLGRYGTEKLMKNVVAVETMKATLLVRRGSQIFEGIETFEAEIGPVSLSPESLPMITDMPTLIDKKLPELSDNLTFTALSVPNPHIITIVHQIDESLVERIGFAANHSIIFPNGVNVSFVKTLGNNRIFVITYERGVGITYSCGTAMSASSVVATLNGIANSNDFIYVFNKGGMVVCDASNIKQNVILKGNATFVFDTVLDVSVNFDSINQSYQKEIRAHEIEAYEHLQNYAQSIINCN